VTDCFPPAFRECLWQILRRAPRVRGGHDRRGAGRQKVLARSGTFAGHREYEPGDDLRYVDWNAYARTGDLFLKVLEEDDRRTLTICLDRTASMATGEPERYRGARRLAAILGGLALVQLDGLTLVSGPARADTFAGARSVERLLTLLNALPVADDPPLELVRAPVERGWPGSVMLISDFAQPEAVAPALHLLRRNGRRCAGWLPSLRSDREPLLDGRVRLRDPETGAEEVLDVDADLREAMRAELALLARQQEAVFAAVGYPLLRFPLPEEGDFRLTSWFTGPWTYRL
jgi:uncharacterized protein (DUF58 family)